MKPSLSLMISIGGSGSNLWPQYSWQVISRVEVWSELSTIYVYSSKPVNCCGSVTVCSSECGWSRVKVRYGELCGTVLMMAGVLRQVRWEIILATSE